MSDAMFAPSPSQQQLHQHHMQQALHHQQQQLQMTHEQVGDGPTPPTPEIRISSAHRSGKANATPLPQMRNPPEPYVHEFQPKTPERGDPGRTVNGGEDFRDQNGQFHQPGHIAGDNMHFHHTPGSFPRGPFTPRGHQYLDPNMQHMDPAVMQHRQMQQQMLQQQQQQQMFNPLPPVMTPTHGIPPRPGAGGPPSAMGFGVAGNPRGRGRMASGGWLQDPMHSILEEEKERKREMKLLKNREAAREGREKKRRYQMLLEARVSILETQNRALIEELKALKFLFCKPSSISHSQAQQHHPQTPHPPQHQPLPQHHLTQQQQMNYDPQVVL